MAKVTNSRMVNLKTEGKGDNAMCPVCKTGHHVDGTHGRYVTCPDCLDAYEADMNPWH